MIPGAGFECRNDPARVRVCAFPCQFDSGLNFRVVDSEFLSNRPPVERNRVAAIFTHHEPNRFGFSYMARFSGFGDTCPFSGLTTTPDNCRVLHREFRAAVPTPNMKAVAAITFADLNQYPTCQRRGRSVGRREITPEPLCHEFAPQNPAAADPCGIPLAARSQALLICPFILVESRLVIEQANGDRLSRPARRCLAPTGRTHDDASRCTTIAHHSLELFDISEVERSSSILCINNNPGSRSSMPAMID